MKFPTPRRVANRIRTWVRGDGNAFLRKVSGVVHVGANVGQERARYDQLGLRVLWIEPIPAIFDKLEENIRDFPKQRALQSLVTDRDGEEYTFHVASNSGASSSIFELELHKDVWPNVTYTSTLSLRSTTLASLLAQEQIDPDQYQALVIDTQGAELLVLKGSLPLLHKFKYIKAEAADFESYKGCCLLADITSFLTQQGFELLSRRQFARRTQGGGYFDVVYRRKD